MKNGKKYVILASIFLLLILLLVSLTYAYYRTRVIGNENPTTINVSGKKMIVQYQNEDPYIEVEDFEPGSSTSKTFEVENLSSSESVFNIIFDEIENAFIREDILYKIYEGTEINESNLLNSGIITKNTKQKIVQGARLNGNETKKYLVVINYQDLPTVDQSIDMEATLDLRLNIEETTIIDESDKNTLLYAIGKNNIIEPTKTTPGENISLENEAVLAATIDDLGDTYYFRGNVKNNYINFAGMCWRIVRIQGDGGIKLILEDKNTTCNSETFTGNWQLGKGNYGSTYFKSETTSNEVYPANYLEPTFEPSKSMVYVFYNFQENVLKDFKTSLKIHDWCFDNNAYPMNSVNLSTTAPLSLEEKYERYESLLNIYYDTYIRLNSSEKGNLTLKCSGTTINKFKNVINEGTNLINETDMYVGALTARETVFAGSLRTDINNNYYLKSLNHYWTLSLQNFQKAADTVGKDYAFIIQPDGKLGVSNVPNTVVSHRPSIVLNETVTYKSGNGTIESPYEIN